MTGLCTVPQGWAAGRGRPALPKRETTFQTSTYSRRYTCGRTRIAPTEAKNNIPNEYLLAALYLRADENRPLPKRKTTFQTSTCSRRYTCGRTRIAPTTLYQSLYLPLLNVISTEARVKPERSGEIPRGSHSTAILLTLFSTLFVGVADGRAVRPRTAA